MPQGHEMFGQALRSLEGPRLERGQKLRLVDQAILQAEQAEEKITIGGDACHGPGLPKGWRVRESIGGINWCQFRFRRSNQFVSVQISPVERNNVTFNFSVSNPD
jgi:hypothetical protein